MPPCQVVIPETSAYEVVQAARISSGLRLAAEGLTREELEAIRIKGRFYGQGQTNAFNNALDSIGLVLEPRQNGEVRVTRRQSTANQAAQSTAPKVAAPGR